MYRNPFPKQILAKILQKKNKWHVDPAARENLKLSLNCHLVIFQRLLKPQKLLLRKLAARTKVMNMMPIFVMPTLQAYGSADPLSFEQHKEKFYATLNFLHGP